MLSTDKESLVVLSEYYGRDTTGSFAASDTLVQLCFHHRNDFDTLVRAGGVIPIKAFSECYKRFAGVPQCLCGDVFGQRLHLEVRER